MSTNQPTACRTVIDAIDEYIDGNSTAVETQQIEDHLNSCSDCRAYVERHCQMLQLTRSALQLDCNDRHVPDGLIERTLKKLKKI